MKPKLLQSRTFTSLFLALSAASFLPALACNDTQRPSTTEPVSAMNGSAATEPLAPALSPLVVDEVSALICGFYSRWPYGDVEGELSRQWEVMAASLDEAQHRLLIEARPTVVAAERCRDWISEASTADGDLPVPIDHLVGLPGLFAPDAANTDEQQRARYEWTAIGLGCLGLDNGNVNGRDNGTESGGADEGANVGDNDPSLAAEAETFMNQMGYTRESYIRASLDRDDTDMSQRIYAALLACARRAGVDVLE